jgi:hypothetical protein
MKNVHELNVLKQIELEEEAKIKDALKSVVSADEMKEIDEELSILEKGGSKFDVILHKIKSKYELSKNDVQEILQHEVLATYYICYRVTDIHKYDMPNKLRTFNDYRGTVPKPVFVSGNKVGEAIARIYSVLCYDYDVKKHNTVGVKKIVNEGFEHYCSDVEAVLKVKNQKVYEYNGTSFDKAKKRYIEFTKDFNSDTADLQELHAVMLYYVVGSVKLAMKGSNIKPKHPKMLYLYGGQGYGKSLLHKLLFTHIGSSNYTSHGTIFDCLNDKFSWADMLSKPVTLIDEFSPLFGKHYSDFKSFVTYGEQNVRSMYKQDGSNVEPITTFIAASNQPINKTITDPTGNRRTWQITMKKMADSVVNKYTTNGVPNKDISIELFQLVDEDNIDRYIAPYLDRIAKVQEQFEHNPLIVEYTYYYGLDRDDGSDNVITISGKEMRMMFCRWSEKFNKVSEANKYKMYSPDDSDNAIIVNFGLAMRDRIPKNEKLINKRKYTATQYTVLCNQKFKDDLEAIREYSDVAEVDDSENDK